MVELKGCPFCGAGQERICQAATMLDDFTIYSVECQDCHAEIADDESQSAADAHWNTRPPTDEALRIAELEAENGRILAGSRDNKLHFDVLKADYDALQARGDRLAEALDHILNGALSLPRFAEAEARPALTEWRKDAP